MNKFLTLLVLFFIADSALAQQTPQGFFLNDFQPRSFVAPAIVEYEKPTSTPSVIVTTDYTDIITKVSPNLFGNNANIYMSQMVDQPALINHIKTLSPNLIRFPGGNISSVFFWNRDVGNPPADAPTKLLDSNGAEQDPGYWYGKNTANWTMSLDNYYEMLKQTNSKGIITVNYAYARYSTAIDPVAQAAHLAADWVRYDNGRTKYWEIGNESNGTWQAGFRIKTSDNKDGQPEIITGDLYGKHFKVFADSMKKAANEMGTTIYIGAQLLQEDPASWANNTDKTWNNGVFAQAGNFPDYFIIHSYYTPYATNSSAADILSTGTKVTRDMMDYVTNAVANAGLSSKPIALTEWNIFAEGSKQQASYINGMHAAIVLGELIKNKYGEASRWDLANSWGNGNDHGMFNQGDEPGGVPKWNPRAVYYYMYYFQQYFGDHMINSVVSGSSDVLAYTGKFESGEVGVVLINKGKNTQVARINLSNTGYGERYYFYTLTGGTDNGEFSLKVSVNGQPATYASGGPTNFSDIPAKSATIGNGVKINVPPLSVTYVVVESGSNVVTDEVIMGLETKVDSSFYVYANPSTGNFSMKLPNDDFSQIKIIDLKGREVFVKELKNVQNELSLETNLQPGVYTIHLQGKMKTYITKLIIR